MIDPKLLTKENGFEDGVVVEVCVANGVTYYAVFHDVNESRLCIQSPEGRLAYTRLQDLALLRPLTGPMSIWNHIPPTAVAICRGDDGYPAFLLYKTHPAVTEMYERWAGYPIEYKPFWAKATQERLGKVAKLLEGVE